MQNKRHIFKHETRLHCQLADLADFDGVPASQFKAPGKRVSAKRQREFTAGRAIVDSLLAAEFDCKGATVGVDADRCPVWPNGITGSISHTDSMVAIALGEKDGVGGVGIDIEIEGAVGAELLDSILTDSEIRRHAGNDLEKRLTLAFACKEAFYKAVFPIFRQPMEFKDVEVQLGNGMFRVTSSPEFSSSVVCDISEGFFEYHENHIAALYRVPEFGVEQGQSEVFSAKDNRTALAV